MNDWEIKKFLRMVLAIQLAVLGLVGLAALGFDIPGIRQIVSLVYLAFIPGVIILRILKLHKLGTVETLLYSVGLSIAFVMLLGFFINMLYPLIGISKPISTFPLITTITTAILILCAIAYKRDNSFSPPTHLEKKSIISPPILFLVLLPLLSVLGTYLVNFHQNNILLLILIALIAVAAALVTFNRFIPIRLYPLVVVMIALALLWHWSLITSYLTGWDIHVEYYFQNLVLTNSSWNYTIPSNVNATLSITMLAPIYSLILNMDTVWVFKIIYPLFFSLVPLALFQVFRKQTDDKIAFMAAFFFMSFAVISAGLFYARLQVAQLFFALSILLLIDKRMATIKRAALLIIFGFSIVVSHYGLSYFYMFYLLLALFLLSLARSSALSNLWLGLSSRFSKGSGTDVTNSLTSSMKRLTAQTTLSTSFVALLVVFGLAWFMYTASGSPFNTIVRIADHLYHSLSEFFIFGTRDPAILLALGLASPEVASLQRNIFLVIQYITQFFIVVGVIGLLFNLRETRFQPVYVAITLISIVLIMVSIVMPYFTVFQKMSRTYLITLFFLAPFCVLGGITTFRWLLRLVPLRAFRASTNPGHLKLVVMLVLIPYLLFITGFIFEVSGDVPTSIALNAEIDYPRFNEQELSGKAWLLFSKQEHASVYADQYGWLLLLGHIPRHQLGTFWGETAKIPDNTYIYLRSVSAAEGKVIESEEHYPYRYVDLQSSEFYKNVLAHRSKIYDNGGSQVYR